MAHARTSSPHSMIVLGQGPRTAWEENSSSQNRPSSGSNSRKKYVRKQSSDGGMEVLPPEGDESVVRLSSAGSTGRGSDSRSNSASKRAPPVQRCDAASIRRTPTPTRQVTLQAVRRKEVSEDFTFGELDWTDHKDPVMNKNNHSRSKDLNHKMNNLSVSNTHQPQTETSGATGGVVANAQSSLQVEEVEESSSSDSEEEEEEPAAPNELMMEFVTSLMQEDYENAQKLCKMILIYEPENPEALKFLPLIEEKQQLEKEMAEAETDSEEGSTDEDDSDDDDEEDDSDEDDDDDDSAASSTEEEEEGSADPQASSSKVPDEGGDT